MATQQDNKRIAKNTLFLYIRMLLVMVVSLYTSRVVLQQLGIDDYGIYSVIGGVITLFTFFNQAMSSSTQRYITYELGKTDGNVSKVFSVCLKIHFYMALAIVVLAETVGLWFVNNKMVFPTGSMFAVNWTYQIAIFSCVVTILRFPYNALVLAHEKMSFYAYNSIVEVILKLLIVFLLVITTNNKLIFYMAMLATVTLLMTLWYVIFCKRNFADVRLIKVKEKGVYKEIISFSGWATFGSIANVGYQQMVVIIINLFYGVAINAAVGIANQINAAVHQFVSGFQQALNPQLIKTQAAGDRNRQSSLINMSAKFSFIIMLLISYPLICNIDYVLKVWLGDYPAQTGIIATLIILGALLETLSGPLWVSIFATGKIKNYQIIVSAILLLNVPLAYFLGHSDYPVWSIFIIRILIFIVALCTRLYFLKKLIAFNSGGFIKSVIVPLATVCILLYLNAVAFRLYYNLSENFFQLIVQCLYFFLTSLPVIVFIGLTKSEYGKIKELIQKRFRR